jgi:hypothetical protein
MRMRKPSLLEKKLLLLENIVDRTTICKIQPVNKSQQVNKKSRTNVKQKYKVNKNNKKDIIIIIITK